MGAGKRRRTGRLAVMMHMEMRDVNVAAARSSNGGAGGGRRRQRWSQSDILSGGVAELGGNSCWRGLEPHVVFVLASHSSNSSNSSNSSSLILLDQYKKSQNSCWSS